MSTWFCETFCCFFLRFRNWLQHPRDIVAGDDHLEAGVSIYALPNLTPRYQQHQPQPPSPLPMPTVYPGGPLTSHAPKKHLPPRLNPRSVPLPVNYPSTETPTGKNFKHRSTPPNRMKPLPPLRTTFDGGGGVDGRKGTRSIPKPTTSSSNATLSTPAPPYFSDAPSSSAASVPRTGKGEGAVEGERGAGEGRREAKAEGFPFLRELDKSFSVDISKYNKAAAMHQVDIRPRWCRRKQAVIDLVDSD
ncbi:MAG: hypothetical protein Q9169_006552 [Polycauliona sp. 2 TL-2023]